jgi:ABC-type branched-subunit amino acid transport system ATPase component/ABC-type branched-subunit amino acid transport system permease subunit
VQYLSFAILGLGAGALIAFLGMGVVLTYRGSGVVNFAVGAVAMYIAYVYYGLRAGGVYLVPIPDVGPKFESLPAGGAGMGTVPALGLSLLTAAGLGVIIHYLVMRPLRRAPVLAKVVATLGILLVLQSIIALKFGTATVDPIGVLPSFRLFSIGSSRVPIDRMLLTGAAIAAAAVLALVFTRSRFGLATRAATENEKGAVLLGVSPDFQAVATWTGACVIAGAVGILVSPITTLTPSQFSLLIVPALAAALFGRLTSFGTTAVAGIIIGALQNILTLLPNKWSWFPKSGGPEAIPLIAIIVAMFVVGKSLPTRGMLANAKLPAVPSTTRKSFVGLGLMLGVFALLLFTVSTGYRLATINSISGAVLALSLVVLVGFVGQLSLFQMALAGTAAFMLFEFETKWGVPFPLSMVLAALASVVVSLIGAIPALRVRGVHLAIVTLALGSAIQELYFNNPSYTGGLFGAHVSGPKLFGLDLGFSKGAAAGRQAFGLFALVTLALVASAILNLRRSRTGRQMLAVRANERAAAASGVDVRATKIIAFALSAFTAGLGGCLIAYQQGSFGEQSFDALLSLSVLALAYLGGITSVSGGMIGGLLATGGLAFYVLQELVLNHVTNGVQLEGTIAGVGLILTAIFNQAGIAGEIRRVASTISAKRARWQGVELARLPVPGLAIAGGVDVASSIVTNACLATNGKSHDGPPRTILRTEGLSVRFGGLQALKSADLAVDDGTIVGLIGPNGAGKTTFIDAVSGFVGSTGSVVFQGERVDRLPPHIRAHRGLARTFQSVELFDDLTVRENLQIAAERSTWWSPLADVVVPRRGGQRQSVAEKLGIVGLEHLADAVPENLSLGERKLIGVARALAAGPSLILLDEPGAGLDTAESRVLADQLRRVRDNGVSILLVDHDMGLVLDVCDFVYVLEFGSIIASGTPAEVRADANVIAAYLGDEGAEIPLRGAGVEV